MCDPFVETAVARVGLISWTLWGRSMRSILILVFGCGIGYGVAFLCAGCNQAAQVAADAEADREWGEGVRERVADYVEQAKTKVASHDPR